MWMREEAKTLQINVCETFEVNPQIDFVEILPTKQYVLAKGPYIKDLFAMIRLSLAMPPNAQRSNLIDNFLPCVFRRMAF